MDYGEKKTDEFIDDLESRIVKEYKTALKEVREKYDNFSKKFAEDDAQKKKELSEGKITEGQYKAWRQKQLMTGSHWHRLLDILAEDLTKVDKKVASMSGEYLPEAYAVNCNYITYEIEKNLRIDTSFTLYSRETVEKLIKDTPTLLPKPRVDIPKDKLWNKKHINSAILQGVLQGDDIDTISRRLQSVTDMDRRAAVRNARTMMIGAQNSGRMDAFRRAKALGIDIKKQWIATLDHKTRDSHANLDGEIVDVEEKFSNGLMFPGDSTGEPSEVYNCRCKVLPYYPEYEDENLTRLDNVTKQRIKYKTYNEWNTAHKPSVVNGKDISATWKRRENEFKFEIEDIINAQGFDGLPKVVSAEEFDEYVKQANGGEGFIAQRTYSAPNQETLDAYRNQLYKGKWYVDCSTGGAQYGQGMYCAADYNGNLTKGIQNEMKHYQIAGNDRIGEISQDDLGLIIKNQKDKANEVLKRYKNGEISREAGIAETRRINAMTPSEYVANYMKDSKIIGARSYTETFTLDPSAKIISFEDLRKLEKEYSKKYYEQEIEKAIKDMPEIEKAMFRYTNIMDTKQDRKLISDFKENSIDEYREIMDKKRDLWHEMNNDIKGKVRDIERMNDGSFAAMLGYDAINAEGHGESGSYTVILNRTKVIFLEGKND